MKNIFNDLLPKLYEVLEKDYFINNLEIIDDYAVDINDEEKNIIILTIKKKDCEIGRKYGCTTLDIIYFKKKNKYTLEITDSGGESRLDIYYEDLLYGKVKEYTFEQVLEIIKNQQER